MNDKLYIEHLKKIGKYLKEQREAQSYTLKHISDITRITLTNLENLEEGNFKQLPHYVFVRGFIKNYADILNIDSSWLLSLLQSQNQLKDKSPEVPEETLDPITTIATNTKEKTSKPETKKTNPKSKNKLLQVIFQLPVSYNISILAIIVIIISITIWQVNTSKINLEITPMNSKQTTVLDKQVKPEPIKQPLLKATPLTLKLEALQSGWIQVKIDNNEIKTILIQKNKTYEWSAQKNYIIFLSTGEMATLYLNEEQISIPDDTKNQLQHITLDKFSLASSS